MTDTCNGHHLRGFGIAVQKSPASASKKKKSKSHKTEKLTALKGLWYKNALQTSTKKQLEAYQNLKSHKYRSPADICQHTMRMNTAMLVPDLEVNQNGAWNTSDSEALTTSVTATAIVVPVIVINNPVHCHMLDDSIQDQIPADQSARSIKELLLIIEDESTPEPEKVKLYVTLETLYKIYYTNVLLQSMIDLQSINPRDTRPWCVTLPAIGAGGSAGTHQFKMKDIFQRVIGEIVTENAESLSHISKFVVNMGPKGETAFECNQTGKLYVLEEADENTRFFSHLNNSGTKNDILGGKPEDYQHAFVATALIGTDIFNPSSRYNKADEGSQLEWQKTMLAQTLYKATDFESKIILEMVESKQEEAKIAKDCIRILKKIPATNRDSIIKMLIQKTATGKYRAGRNRYKIVQKIIKAFPSKKR